MPSRAVRAAMAATTRASGSQSAAHGASIQGMKHLVKQDLLSSFHFAFPAGAWYTVPRGNDNA